MDDLMGIAFHAGNLNSHIGYIGDEHPSYTTSSVFYSFLDGIGKPQTSIDDLNRFSEVRQEVFPLFENSVIKNVESYCEFVNAAALKINCKLSELPLVVATSDDERTYTQDRRKMASYFFEKNDSPAVYFVSKALATIFSCGKLNGVIVDSGAHQTECAAVYDGYLLRKSLRSLPIGGEHLTVALRQEFERAFAGKKIPLTSMEVDASGVTTISGTMLTVSYQEFLMSGEYRIIKETVLTFSPKEEIENDDRYVFEMPDGQMMKVRSPANFSKNIFEMQSPHSDETLSSKIINLVEDCHIDCRKILLNNLMLSGGNSLLPNFQKNFEANLFESSPAYMKMKVSTTPKNVERKIAPWLGASILASVGDFQKFWISKFDYQETGENIVLRKCIN